MSALLDARIRQIGKLFPKCSPDALLRHLGVNVGEGLAQPLGVAARRSAHRNNVRRQTGIATTDDADGFAMQGELEVTRLAVPPLEHAFLAVHPQPDVVLAAGCRLRDSQRAARAPAELDQSGDVIDELATRKQRPNIRRDTLSS